MNNTILRTGSISSSSKNEKISYRIIIQKLLFGTQSKVSFQEMLEFKKICFIDITTPKTFGKVKVKAILGSEITNQNIERPFSNKNII